jgi:hypothetical protein
LQLQLLQQHPLQCLQVWLLLLYAGVAAVWLPPLQLQVLLLLLPPFAGSRKAVALVGQYFLAGALK